MQRTLRLVALALLEAVALLSQVTSGEILGVVQDLSGMPVAEAQVSVRSLDTGRICKIATAADGRFRVRALPAGSYEVIVEREGFARYVQGPVALRVNQIAELRIKLLAAAVAETITVDADAPLLNTANAEVGVSFDSRRIAELPLTPNRNILGLALSVAGVSQLSPGQSEFASGGVSFSVNGMRTRSNNFLVDGQDVNDPVTTGLAQAIHNPDAVAEVRFVTSQFAPEYGRTAGSVVNIVTRQGSNEFHASAFWFHNDNHLNSRSNLDEAPIGIPPRPRFEQAPFRVENQFGGTLGGPLRRNRTFFFGSLQRWTDRQLSSGPTIRGVPTEEGRRLLNELAGDRPTVRILLEHLPAAQAPVPNLVAPITVNGATARIPLGTLSGYTVIRLDNWQWSARVDHQVNARHSLGGRYLYNDQLTAGAGQVTPPGLSTRAPMTRQAAAAWLTSLFTPFFYGELRLGWQRFGSTMGAADPRSEQVPSIEVPELGLSGFNAASSRTAIGLAVNLPQFRFSNNYQLQYTLGATLGRHALKMGIDLRQQDLASLFLSSTRGRLVYSTLQDLVDDVAQTAFIQVILPGGEPVQHYRYKDCFWFVQDEWRPGRRLTLTYGIRYESPGNPIENLRKANDRIVAAAGGNPAYRLEPVPRRDVNNWGPRFGFSYLLPRGRGPFRYLTGEDKLALRGGYSRTYDFGFLNIALNVGNGFPFLNAINLPPRTPNALTRLQEAARAAPEIPEPLLMTRTTVGADFRSPYAEQFALQFQRQLWRDWLLALGYVGTKGTALYQTIDGNPTLPENNNRGTLRLDPTRGVIRLRANATSSIYHSMQTSLEKRLSHGVALAAHYTWSTFIDGASEIFNPSASGEVAVAQDSYNRRADRARSSYDRPHRLTVNAVYELPFFRRQRGWLGRLLGGWQASCFVTLQSGAPFTALDGADPGFRLSGIDSLVGNAIRANTGTQMDLARMSVEELYWAGGARLFSRVTAQNPLGNLGRNVLRADGITDMDVGFIKNMRVSEANILQFRAEFYTATNTRDFGIPESRVSSANFLNQWGQDGGNRRIVLALRYLF